LDSSFYSAVEYVEELNASSEVIGWDHRHPYVAVDNFSFFLEERSSEVAGLNKDITNSYFCQVLEYDRQKIHAAGRFKGPSTISLIREVALRYKGSKET
jgi:hypothetical protein